LRDFGRISRGSLATTESADPGPEEEKEEERREKRKVGNDE